MQKQLLSDMLTSSKVKYKPAILVAIIIIFFGSVCIVIQLFPTRLGNIVVDYFAFAAGILLISDALYKLRTEPEKPWSYQLVRLCRLIIGVCIFTIHALQFIYKV
ncbi:MAG: hypothetical protein N3A72_10545 [bacterium]|nr:hypothetical protein [bacterium]